MEQVLCYAVAVAVIIGYGVMKAKFKKECYSKLHDECPEGANLMLHQWEHAK